MKLALTGTGVLAVAALAAVGYVLWKGSGIVGNIGDRVGDAVNAINPLNHDNVFAQAADAAVTAAAGYEESAGGWVHDFFHGNLPQLKPGEVVNAFEEPAYDAMGNRTN